MKSQSKKEKATASLIYWTNAADKERIERWIKKLQEQGFIEWHTTQDYDPSWGSPVWYIP